MSFVDGSALGGDELSNAYGKVLKNQLRMMVDLSKAGTYSAATTYLDNTNYDAFATDTMTKSNMLFDSSGKLYYGPTDTKADGDLTTIDEFNDSSLDSTKWTDGGSTTGPSGGQSSTEGAAYLTQTASAAYSGSGSTGTAKVTLNGSGAKRLSDYGTIYRFKINAITATIQGGASVSFDIYFDDGVSPVCYC